MPLRVTRRKSTGALTIAGTVRFPDGTRQRIRCRAGSDRPELAAEEAAALEARLLRDAWHGPRRGVRSFGEAVLSYIEAAPRSEGTRRRLNRLLRGLGDVPLATIDQDQVTRLARILLGRERRYQRKDGGVTTVPRRPPSAAAVTREIVTPLRAVLRHAAARGWCEPPYFATPRAPAGRTRYLLPAEAERLLAAAVPHLRPLLVFLLGTGARVAEAVELDWREVDLFGARAILWPASTKTRRRRVLAMPPRAVASLAQLPHREGPVFLWERRPGVFLPYADRGRLAGGQFKRAWHGAIARAGLDPELTPHDLRHSWASWHWALHRDLIALREAGGWSSVQLVERYAHLLPAGEEAAIAAFLGVAQAAPAAAQQG